MEGWREGGGWSFIISFEVSLKFLHRLQFIQLLMWSQTQIAVKFMRILLKLMHESLNTLTTKALIFNWYIESGIE